MFHVKHSLRWPFLTRNVSRETFSRGRVLGLLFLGALVLAGCGSIQKPEGWAAPVAVGDALLVQARTGQLSLVDPETGAVRWRYPEDDHGDRPFYATPVVDGDSVYLVDYKGRVTRLDVGSGLPAQAWEVEAGHQVVATPLLLGDSLHVPTEHGDIVVLDAAGAEQRRVRTADRRIWGSPAGAGGDLYVTDLDHGSTLALDGSTGDEVWEQEASGASAADLALDGDRLFVGSFDRRLHALETGSNGAEAWAFEGDGWFVGRPLAAGGTVYGVTMRGTVYAIDREAGTQQWLYHLEGGEFRSAPVIVDGKLVVAARDGRIVVLDAATGAESALQDVEIEGAFNANPAVLGDVVYYLTSKHDLLAYDVGGNTVRSIPIAGED